MTNGLNPPRTLSISSIVFTCWGSHLQLVCNGAAHYMELSLIRTNDNTEYEDEYSLDNITHNGDIGEETKESSHWLIS